MRLNATAPARNEQNRCLSTRSVTGVTVRAIATATTPSFGMTGTVATATAAIIRAKGTITARITIADTGIVMDTGTIMAGSTITTGTDTGTGINTAMATSGAATTGTDRATHTATTTGRPAFNCSSRSRK